MAANGNQSRTPAITIATATRTTSNRSPMAISVSSKPRSQFVSTELNGVKCQKNGRPSSIAEMS